MNEGGAGIAEPEGLTGQAYIGENRHPTDGQGERGEVAAAAGPDEGQDDHPEELDRPTVDNGSRSTAR
ncbi:hypothetical protein [Streptomyces sp. NPDC087270]|uniref:hypothetical protein n=1 Tax=Streptomyces sp. NPDC087270 TaxID=3365774 RepID=UPI0038112B41